MLASHMCRFEDDLLLSSSLRLTHILLAVQVVDRSNFRVQPRLSVWCIEEKGPAKKEGGWIAPRFRLKEHETLLVYAGLVLGLSTHIF